MYAKFAAGFALTMIKSPYLLGAMEISLFAGSNAADSHVLPEKLCAIGTADF